MGKKKNGKVTKEWVNERYVGKKSLLCCIFLLLFIGLVGWFLVSNIQASNKMDKEVCDDVPIEGAYWSDGEQKTEKVCPDWHTSVAFHSMLAIALIFLFILVLLMGLYYTWDTNGCEDW